MPRLIGAENLGEEKEQLMFLPLEFYVDCYTCTPPLPAKRIQGPCSLPPPVFEKGLNKDDYIP